MTTEHFKALGAELFGYGWQTRLAKALGMEGSTIRRWVSGSVPVAPSAISFLEMLASRQATRGAYLASLDAHMPPADLNPSDPQDIERLHVTHTFTGIDKAKPMPAVISNKDQSVLQLTDDRQNCLDPNFSHLLVRHPDRYHLEAWLSVMRSSGHRPAYVSSRRHYYSAIATPQKGAAALTYKLSTHSGLIRLLEIDDQGEILTNVIHKIIGSSPISERDTGEDA